MSKRFFATLITGLVSVGAVAADYVLIPDGLLTSVLENDTKNAGIPIPAFSMRVLPVTNAEFLAFTQKHPNWQKGQTPSIFADERYLSKWRSASELGKTALANQPVTNISWFAAAAFCESENARLPNWYEWEYVAAADETRSDARSDSVWRGRILNWYAQTSNRPLAVVGGTPNVFGVRDLHGLIWEWVEDYSSMLVSADSRDQGDPDKLRFCGAGAISMRDRENYVVLMRIALLSSLNARDTTNNLGFRCVRSETKE